MFAFTSVLCYCSVAKPGSVQLRLDSPTVTADVKVGSVLTYYNGHWGTILSYSSWNDNHVQIICRQLGYHGSTGDFSPCLSCGHVPCSNKLPIFLWQTDSTCTGNEEVITECDTSDWLATRTCTTPYTTAGVHCSGTACCL